MGSLWAGDGFGIKEDSADFIASEPEVFNFRGLMIMTLVGLCSYGALWMMNR